MKSVKGHEDQEENPTSGEDLRHSLAWLGRQVSAVFMSFIAFTSFMFMPLAPDQTRQANTSPCDRNAE